jgi:hypothetical protein
VEASRKEGRIVLLNRPLKGVQAGARVLYWPIGMSLDARVKMKTE